MGTCTHYAGIIMGTCRPSLWTHVYEAIIMGTCRPSLWTHVYEAIMLVLLCGHVGLVCMWTHVYEAIMLVLLWGHVGLVCGHMCMRPLCWYYYGDMQA